MSRIVKKEGGYIAHSRILTTIGIFFMVVAAFLVLKVYFGSWK